MSHSEVAERRGGGDRARRARPQTVFPRLGLPLLGLLGALAVGCGPARAPALALKPLEERRARAVIEQAIERAGESPAPGRQVKLPSGGDLDEDMAIAGGSYGVAYLTQQEQSSLAGAIVPYDPARQDLYLVQGAGGEVVLVLWEQSYRFDEGSDHTATAVTAEKTLARDVSDYVIHVVRQGKGR
ncbi:MAG: hypothetical protein KC731_01150 [Myxococcales bacterium]|nr:hypothetical protein [Myxococcales bacterium]